MLDDIKVVARCISIWKYHPAGNPKDVWSLDDVLQDVQISSLIFHPYLPLQIPDIKREVGHNTDECMHLKRHIEELIKAGKLSHVIKELKQGSEKDQLKAEKKGETKAESEENSSCSVNSSQNVKIPSSRRNTHSMKQHDNPTRIGRTKGIVQMTQTQPRNICLETLGDDGGSTTLSGTSCERPKRMPSDAYKGRHQIKMAKEDEKKTTFIISQGIFCYSKMLFEMKNVKVTYQCLVYKAFQKQFGRNLDVYVDNLVIKSRMEHEIIRDTKETFKTLREINMKLNSKKSTFGIEEGMFLGYKANTKGIKVCSNKVEGVLSVPSPKRLKELLAELPTLTKPMKKEELIAYLVAASHFIVKRPEYDSLVTTIEVKEDLSDPWTLFMDGSSCIDGSGTGLILTNPEGIEFTYALRFRFDATNNEAKYEALIAGLRANGTEAVIPVEIGMPTLRKTKIDMVQNDEALKINLDLLEEKREQAAIREARSKTKMEKYYNSNSVTQALNQEALCTGTMMPTMQKIAGSLALSGKDRTK
nr:reverse transcriptase domain-containing protein [Tanacetum cinerariifolium]